MVLLSVDQYEDEHVDCLLAPASDVEWSAELAADVLSCVMQALAELPIEPIAFQQAIMKAAMGVGSE